MINTYTIEVEFGCQNGYGTGGSSTKVLSVKSNSEDDAKLAAEYVIKGWSQWTGSEWDYQYWLERIVSINLTKTY